MNKIALILFLTILTSLNAVENKAYLNITSNVKDTIIYLNGEEIGMTPINQLEVTPNKNISLKAIVDTDYYVNNIEKKIRVTENTIPTIALDFEKAKAKVFLIGENAELYIDGKYIKKLHSENRMITIQTGKAVAIDLLDGDGKAHYIKDIKAKTINNLTYKLIRIPKEVRLYTSTINNLMWEDTKEATTTNTNWNAASLYCSTLKIADYEDFRLPTIDELSELYENKDDIYNGFGGKFYWSASTFQDEHNVWDYSEVKNFDNGLNQKSIKEFEQGRVRCVRDLDIVDENFMDDNI